MLRPQSWMGLQSFREDQSFQICQNQLRQLICGDARRYNRGLRSSVRRFMVSTVSWGIPIPPDPRCLHWLARVQRSASVRFDLASLILVLRTMKGLQFDFSENLSNRVKLRKRIDLNDDLKACVLLDA